MASKEDLDRMRAARIPRPPKEKKPLARESAKTKAKKAAEKKLVSGEGDTLLENWYKARRKEMTGLCGCGCGEVSQKKDDVYFRHSIAHIFPKRLFPSIMYHPLNWVERRFWGGCHSIMDDTSMERWPGMEDWDIIVMRFWILAPLLTSEETATNFFSRLEKLVIENHNFTTE